MVDQSKSLPYPILVLVQLGIPVLALIIATRIVTIFATGEYDIDMDHEMYFGQRLLHGELIWTREFHDKLPFVQLAFAIPAAFESIQAWRILSLSSVVSAAILMVALLPRMLKIKSVSRAELRSVAMFTALSYVSLSTVLPGDLTHINPMAGAFALCATLLMLWQGQAHGSSIWLVFLAGLMAAAAISIRPYLLAPIALIGILASFLPILGPLQRSFMGGVKLLIGFGAATLIFGVILNLVPLYVIAGQMPAFWAGLSMMGQDLNPTEFWGYLFLSFRHGDPVSLGLLFVLISGTLVFFIGVLRGTEAAPFAIVQLLAIICLLVFIAQRHWWPHYISFFVGYFYLFMFGLIIWTAERRNRFYGLNMVVLCSGLGSLVGLAASSAALSAGSLIANPAKFAFQPGPIVETFRAYREKSPTPIMPFLAPGQMALHWIFHEPRHGFPHAVNTSQINRGWWAFVVPNDVFATPFSAAEYCKFLNEQSPPFLVVETPVSPTLPCLREIGSPYTLDAALPVAGQPGGLLVFRRM